MKNMCNDWGQLEKYYGISSSLGDKAITNTKIDFSFFLGGDMRLRHHGFLKWNLSG